MILYKQRHGLLSAAGCRAVADCVLSCVCVSVCNQYSYARYFNNLLIDPCRIYSRLSLHATLEMVNFWSRSRARWLTFGHFRFNHVMVIVDRRPWQQCDICINKNQNKNR